MELLYPFLLDLARREWGWRLPTTFTTYTTTVSTETTTKHSPFDTPLTGYLAKDGKVWLIAMGVIGAMIVFMLVLIHRDRKKMKKMKKMKKNKDKRDKQS